MERFSAPTAGHDRDIPAEFEKRRAFDKLNGARALQARLATRWNEKNLPSSRSGAKRAVVGCAFMSARASHLNLKFAA